MMSTAGCVHFCLGGLLALTSAVAFNALARIEFGFTIALLVDIYLIVLLAECALRSNIKTIFIDGDAKEKERTLVELPGRGVALVLLVFLTTSTVCGYASMYMQEQGVLYDSYKVKVEHDSDSNTIKFVDDKYIINEDHKAEALYFSAVTITTLGYGDFSPITPKSRLIVIWQLFTGALLLLGVFPLVISRLSNF